MVEASPVLVPQTPRNAWERLRAEGRAFRSWVSLRLEARKHRRSASKGRVEIDDASRALARTALPLAVGSALPSRAPAEAARAALATAEAAAREAHATADAARQALARADADAAPRMADAKARVEAAHGTVRTLDRAMPPEPGLEAARASLVEAEASCDREEARLRDVRSPLAVAVERADLHASAADDAVAAARVQEAATLLAFGRELAAAAGSATGPASAAFAAADIAAADIAAPLGALREAQGAAARQEAGAQAASARAHEVAADARRFAWKAGAALAGLVLLVVGIAALAGSGGGGGGSGGGERGASRGAPLPPPPEPASRGGAHVRPTDVPIPTPVRTPSPAADESAAKTPASLLTAAVRAAVLAQPSLAASEGEGGRLQRPVGTVIADDVRPAAGGGRRLRVHADVERRTDAASPLRRSRVLVEVLLDANGAPAQVREVGEVDAETLELFGD